MDWQSMDSAPKDGSEILVYDRKTDSIMLVHWGEDYGFRWCVTHSWQDEQGGYETADSPSHWMPLPNKPNTKK